MMRLQWLVCAIAITAMLAFVSTAPAAEKDTVITSFEAGPGPVTGEGSIVQENVTVDGKEVPIASEGKSSYKIVHEGGEDGAKKYIGIAIEDKKTLGLFKDYLLFKVDIFNPSDKPVRLNVRVDDANSKDFGSRFQDERNNVALPGWSTYELNLTGLTKSNSKNFAQKEKLDINTLKVLKISVSGNIPVTLYFDNLRLEKSGLPVVEGLVALDMGPEKSDVYPGFEQCSEMNKWKADKPECRFGWVNPTNFDNVYMPDTLGGDYGSGDEFNMRLPNGKYIVHLCADPFGIWGAYPRFTTRTITINGKKVLEQKYAPEEFLNKVFFSHEEDEDLPGQDLWAKYVMSRNTPREFEAEVTDGVLKIVLDSDMKYGKFLQYVVVYPEAKKAEGAAWFKALQDQRRDKFNKKMMVQLPAKEQPAAEPTAADKAAGFIPFVRSTETFCYVNSAPQAGETGKPVSFSVAQGERQGAQLGLYPLAEVKGVTVTVSELTGPNGSKIPASAVQVRKVRNFLKRQSRTSVGLLLPYILLDFQSVDLAPGVTRGIWLTLSTPANAAAGEYTGTIKVGTVTLPVNVTVYPFALDKVTDITFSATGARSGIDQLFPKELKDLGWKHSEIALKDMAEHGLNAVTGGPGATLNNIKNGKCDIDYSDMDRWFEMARKYGLTMPGDSYQGCDVNVPNDTKKGGLERMDTKTKEKWGISYKELIAAVYADVEKHAKEKNWPVRSYSFLDEPRPEFGNIESALELIKLRVEAAPNTRFSGYYSTGQGRDEYFKVMPVSITHVNADVVKLTKEAGKEFWTYDGSRTRVSAGLWTYAAAKMGLKGYLTNGYLYVNSDPYFDFSDDEASWCVAYPSRKGINDSVPWERVADGINDYRYLSTIEHLIAKAKTDGKAAAEAKAAADFVQQTTELIDVTGGKGKTKPITPVQYVEFRKTAAGHIIALSKALGNK